MLAIALMAFNFTATSQGTIQIGSGTETTTLFPLDAFWGYNYTQQIYLRTEFVSAGGVAGEITGLRFYYVTGGADFQFWVDGWNLYIGHTTKTNFASTTDWEPLANLSLVYSGSVAPVANSWMEITFTTPFMYDGVNNLIVAVDENTPDYSGFPSASWNSFTAVNNRSIRYRNDGINPDPAAPPTALSISTVVNQIQFIGQQATCIPAQNVVLTTPSLTEVSATWNADAAVSYNYELRTEGEAGSGALGLVEEGNTSNTGVVFGGLTENTAYQFYIQSDCGTEQSVWVGPFNVTIIPGNTCDIAIDLATLTSPYSGTTAGATANFSGPCNAGNTSPDLFFSIVVPPNYTLTIGQSFNDYNSENYLGYGGACPGATQVACFDEPDYTMTTWTNTTNAEQTLYWVQDGNLNNTNFGNFTLDWTLSPPPPCIPLTAPGATLTSLSSADLFWTAPNPAPSNGYEWVLSTTNTTPVDPGTPEAGTSVSVTDLTINTTYYLFVRSICDDPEVSVWVGPFVFATIDGNTCDFAINLNNLTSPYIGTTVGATASYTNACANGNTSPDLVFTIDVPANYTLVIGQSFNDYDSENVLAYGGPCPGTTVISCFDDPDYTSTTWVNTTGETQTLYWIQDGWNNAANAGNFTLDWTLTAPPTCFPPSGLTVYPITLTSADIVWIAPNPEPADGYEYVVSLTNTIPVDPGTSTLVTSASVADLMLNTNYYVFVRAICGPGDPSTWAGPVIISTLEGNTCADAVNLANLTSPYSGTTLGATNNFTNACSFENNSPDLFFYIDVPADYTFVIGQTVNGYDSEIYLGYGDACPGTTIVACYDDPDIQNTTWTNTTGMTQTLYWVQDGWNAAGDAGTFTLEWSLTPPPTCFPPSGITVYPTSLNSADIVWLAPSLDPLDGYEYVISTTATTPVDPGTSTLITSTSVADLALNSTYYIYVRSICGVDDASTWAGPVTFTTIEGNTCEFAIDLGTLTSPYMGTTAGATNNFSGPCSGGNTSPELFFTIDVPAGATLVIGQTENGYDSETYLGYGGACPGTTQIACYDDPDIQNTTWLNNTGETQTLYWVQDGYFNNTNFGTFTLAWSVTIPCAAPDNLLATVTSLDPAQVAISWTAAAPAPQMGYEYSISTDMTVPVGNGTLTTDEFVIYDMAEYNTVYYAYVRSRCDETSTSSWVGPMAFEVVAVFGCINSDACNYDANANVDDQSCTFSTMWFLDADNDGYGHADVSLMACEMPEGYAADGTDCDDTDDSKWQSAELYIDADGDGYNTGLETVCFGTEMPVGYSVETAGDDCDDSDDSKWQSGEFYSDMDGDSYDNGLEVVCYGESIPTGYSPQTSGADCDDTNGLIWQSGSLFVDQDADGYDAGSAVVCFGATTPTGYAVETLGTDCDDNDVTQWDAMPINVTVTLTLDTLCSNFNETAVLSGGSPLGGTWSGIAVNAGVFNSGVSGVGAFELTYTVNGDGACLQTASANGIVIAAICVGVEELTADVIELYPSVTSGNVTISAQSKLIDATIMDMNGRRLNTKTINGTTAILQMEEYASGIYFIHVRGVSTENTFKVVKVD